MMPELPVDRLAAVAAALPHESLAGFREAGRTALARHGLPTTRVEDWKYTDLADAAELSRAWLAAGAPVDAPDAERIREAQGRFDAHWLVIANGALLEDYSDALSLPGVGVVAAADELSAPRDALGGLNAALVRDPIRVRVTEPLANPLALLVADSAATSAGTAQVRVALAVDSGASVQVFEQQVSSGDHGHYSNVLVELDLAANSGCDYVRLQQRATGHSQTARLNVRLDRDARFHYFGADLGGQLSRHDLAINIAGRGASATLNGVYVAGPGQHVDNHTRTDHRFGPASSRQEYRGILAGRARAVWNGKAIVHAGADGTDAEQANHNLLLTEQAEVDAKPELEIYADDVKCAHGTTVGHLDERALYYLRTRGIGRQRARRILTRAFAATVVDTAPIEALREVIGEAVEARLRDITAEIGA